MCKRDFRKLGNIRKISKYVGGRAKCHLKLTMYLSVFSPNLGKCGPE